MLRVPPLNTLLIEDDAALILADLPEEQLQAWFQANGLGEGAEGFSASEIAIALDKVDSL